MHQNRVIFEVGGLLTVKGDESIFLKSVDVLFLNLNAECMDVFTFKNSLSCTFKVSALYHTYIIHYTTIRSQKIKIFFLHWGILNRSTTQNLYH